MTIRLKCLSCLFMLNILMGNIIDIRNYARAQGSEEFLDWSIETSKKTFCPGEPILLILKIKNIGKKEQEIYFGGGGIEAFSLEILDSNRTVVVKGEKIQRPGVSRFITVKVAPGKIGTRSIVLNRWCSTLMPLGRYYVICNVDYRLLSELVDNKSAHILPYKVRLELDIQITKLNTVKFKKIIEGLAKRAFTADKRSAQGLARRQIAANLLTFTESAMAVPNQLRILRSDQYTWLKRDVIDSLVWSETLEAATGLVKVIEDPSIYMEDVKREAVDSVYRLRETGKSDIISATNEFVSKHKRPVLAKSVTETRRVREKPIAETTKPIIERTPLWNWRSFLVVTVVGMSTICFILFLKKKTSSRNK